MEIVAGKFPSDTERERVATLNKYAHLYEGEHFAVLRLHEVILKQYIDKSDLIYLQENLPAYISDFFGDFVAGDVDKLVIQAGNGDTEAEKFVDEVVFENDLKQQINNIAIEQSEFGFTPLLGWLDNDQVFHIDAVSQDQFFPQSDGSVIFLTYYKRETVVSKTTYALTESYIMSGNDCLIERKAWECNDRGIVTLQVSMQTFEAVTGRSDIKENDRIEGVGELQIRQVDNTKRTKWGFGKSDYADIMPQLEEINERNTHISTVLIKNLNSKMTLPSNLIDEDGKVVPFEAIGMENKDIPEPKYITNTNPLMADAREHIMSQTKVISLIAAVPMFELLKSAMPERVESLKIQLFSSIRRTHRKRAKIKRALQDMFRIGAKMKGIDFNDDARIEFGDVVPKDDQIEANTEDTKVRAGLSSRQSAIMRLENINEDDAKKEMELIREEDKISGVMNPANPPQLPADIAPVVK